MHEVLTEEGMLDLIGEALEGFDYCSRSDKTCKVCKRKYSSPAIANYCERRHESMEISPDFETFDEQYAWNKMTISEMIEWTERNE